MLRREEKKEEEEEEAQTNNLSASDPTNVPKKRLDPNPTMKNPAIDPREYPYDSYNAYTYGP